MNAIDIFLVVVFSIDIFMNVSLAITEHMKGNERARDARISSTFGWLCALIWLIVARG